MAYQVLARKYRPQRFSDVAGQDHVTRTLRNALAQGRVAHGYIFSGHRGIGKTTIARILAMALNCRCAIGGAERPDAEPCGVCDSCREVRAGNSVDVMEIDAATNRGIDEIRELRDAARYRPARDRYRIYLLDEAHQITDAAFNALLKTLEEPPDHVVFMMATTQPEDIPQTIRSRCQHFSFHAVKFDDIRAQLRQIAESEGISAGDAALALLAEAGDGSMRDALSIMDQAIATAPVVDGRARLEVEQIRELMGAVPNTVFERLMEAIGESRSAAVIEQTDRLLNAGNSPSQIARQFVRYLRNCLMAKLGGEDTELLQVSGEERARAHRSAALFSEEDLTRFLQVMLRTFDELNYRQEQRFHLELGLLKLVHLGRLLPLEQILSGLSGAAPTKPASRRPSLSPAARSNAELRPEPGRAAVTAPADLEGSSAGAPQPSAGNPNDAPEADSGFAAADLDRLRDAILASLETQGHHTASALLAAGTWSLAEGGAIHVRAGVSKTMLSLAMNAEAWTIVRTTLGRSGAARKMFVVPEETAGDPAVSVRPAAAGSIHARALENPLVRQAQELFRAEVRSVLDLREGAVPGPRDER